MKKYLIVILGFICFLSGCNGDKADKNEISNIDIATDSEIEYQEDIDVKREFCEVVEGEDNFVLKNTVGELYRLDLSLQEDFKEGDEVLLIYTERTQVEDGVYEAEVYAVYPDSSVLEKTAK